MRKGLCFAQCCAAARRKAAPVLALLVYTLGFGLSANAQGGTIITFDAPGAVNGTEALAMNPAGSITGFYFDANFVPHGFLRAKNGSFTTFDTPGAGLNESDCVGSRPIIIQNGFDRIHQRFKVKKFV